MISCHNYPKSTAEGYNHENRLLLIAFIAATLTTAFGAASQQQIKESKKFAEDTKSVNNLVSVFNTGVKNVKVYSPNNPANTTLTKPLGNFLTGVKTIAATKAAYDEKGAGAAVKTVVKEGAAKVAGDYVGTAVGTAVTTATAPILGPLAPVAGTLAGIGAKHITQTVVKGTIDTTVDAIQTGKMPDTTKTIGDAQYKNSGGDKGWKAGDVYVAPDGKQYKAGGEFVSDNGTQTWPPGYAFDPSTGRHFRLPDKTSDNCKTPPPSTPSPDSTPTGDNVAYGPDGKVHQTGTKTTGGTQLGPNDYQDPKTGHIFTQNPLNNEWTEKTENDYRSQRGLPPVTPPPANDWGSGLGGLFPNGCSGPSGCSSDSSSSSSSSSNTEKKDESKTSTTSTTSKHSEELSQDKGKVEPTKNTVSEGTTALSIDDSSAPATSSSDHSTGDNKTTTTSSESQTGVSEGTPLLYKEGSSTASPTSENKGTSSSDTKTTPATKDAPTTYRKSDNSSEGQTAFSIDNGSDNKTAAQTAAQTASRTAAQTAARSVKPPVVRPPVCSTPCAPPRPPPPPRCSGKCN